MKERCLIEFQFISYLPIRNNLRRVIRVIAAAIYHYILSKDGIFHNDMIAPFKGVVSLIPPRCFSLESRGHEMRGCPESPTHISILGISARDISAAVCRETFQITWLARSPKRRKPNATAPVCQMRSTLQLLDVLR